MSVSKASTLIAEGKYDGALAESQKITPSIDLVFQSRIAELTGHFDDALNLGKRAEQEAKTPEDKIAAAIAKAYAYWRLFMFDSGHDALDRVEELTDDTTVGTSIWHGTYHNIRGLLYWKAQDFDKAMESFQEALLLRRQYSTQSDVGYTLNNLGNTYLKLDKLVKAEKFFHEARELRKGLGHKPGIAASANSYARLEDSRDNYHKAKTYHEQCLALWKEVGNTQFIAKAYRFLAVNASLRNDKKEMMQYYDKSDELFKQIGNEVDLKTNKQMRKK